MNDLVNIEITEINEQVTINVDEVTEVVNIEVNEITEVVNIEIQEVGQKGDNGINGKSAYQIALDNGFIGTETEWLDSLKADVGRLHYSHTQNISSSIWAIDHNLGFFPNAQTFDSSNREIEGIIMHLNNNSLTIDFNGHQLTGTAYLS